MKAEKKSRKIKKYQWVLGFFGFMGFAGFLDVMKGLDTGAFVFFAFFGFFSWYWEYKLQQGIEDERLTENRLKAKSIAFTTAMMIIWLSTIFSNNLFPKIFPALGDYKNRYAFLTAIIAIGFAVGLILQSFLAYRYDTKE